MQRKYLLTNNLKMQVGRPIQFIILFLYILQAKADGISCFKCVTAPTTIEEYDTLCSHFDASAKYQVFCNTSTLCMKKTIYHKFQTSIVSTTVVRDCAAQKLVYPTYDVEDKKWNDQLEIVKTAYDEGCFIGENRAASETPPEYCYCSYHLCNSTSTNKIRNIDLIFLSLMTSLFIKSIVHL